MKAWKNVCFLVICVSVVGFSNVYAQHDSAMRDSLIQRSWKACWNNRETFYVEDSMAITNLRDRFRYLKCCLDADTRDTSYHKNVLFVRRMYANIYYVEEFRYPDKYGYLSFVWNQGTDEFMFCTYTKPQVYVPSQTQRIETGLRLAEMDVGENRKCRRR